MIPRRQRFKDAVCFSLGGGVHSDVEALVSAVAAGAGKLGSMAATARNKPSRVCGFPVSG